MVFASIVAASAGYLAWVVVRAGWPLLSPSALPPGGAETWDVLGIAAATFMAWAVAGGAVLAAHRIRARAFER